MINWIPLQSEQEIERIIEHSEKTPCLLFKHSITCDLSALAKLRLESDWDFEKHTIKTYFLDILAYPTLSKLIVEQFHVEHESPQVILIRDGYCTYDASHLDITVEELKDSFDSKF